MGLEVAEVLVGSEVFLLALERGTALLRALGPRRGLAPAGVEPQPKNFLRPRGG